MTNNDFLTKKALQKYGQKKIKWKNILITAKALKSNQQYSLLTKTKTLVNNNTQCQYFKSQLLILNIDRNDNNYNRKIWFLIM